MGTRHMVSCQLQKSVLKNRFPVLEFSSALAPRPHHRDSRSLSSHMESKEPTSASSSPITLGYGRDGLRVELPNSVDVTLICKAPSAIPADQGALIDAALNNPDAPKTC